jgi:hypothetical protein
MAVVAGARTASACCPMDLLRQYDVVSLGDVQIRNTVRNHSVAKSISDAGWVAVRTILEAKVACAGRQVIAVPAQYTSQDCSGVLPDGSRCPLHVAGRHKPVNAHPCPPLLWAGAGPRRERGGLRSAGRAGPSGASVGRWAERRLSSPRREPWGACHTCLHVQPAHRAPTVALAHALRMPTDTLAGAHCPLCHLATSVGIRSMLSGPASPRGPYLTGEGAWAVSLSHARGPRGRGLSQHAAAPSGFHYSAP